MRPEKRDELKEGDTLWHGTYRIEAQPNPGPDESGIALGAGAYGIVYLGTTVRLRQRVVVKELFPFYCRRLKSGEVAPDGKVWTEASWRKARERVLAEGQALAALSHPNIVRVVDVFEERGTTYLVMEHIDGQTLDDYALDRGRLDVAETAAIGSALASALTVVHAANLRHRDIKPSNIMRRPDGSPVLIDFGAAREVDPNQPMTLTGIGTEGFMPPEQYRSSEVWLPSLDIYALSATLYVLLTNAKLQPSPARILQDDVRPLSALRPDAPAALSDLIAAGMSIQASDRPQTAAAFSARLAASIAPERPVVAVPPPKPVVVVTDPRHPTPDTPHPVSTARINLVDSAAMVWIPGGKWQLGDSDQSDNPVHTVTLSGYWMYRYPVTVAQFRRFTGDRSRNGGFTYDWNGRRPSWGWIDDHPMVRVSWEDASAYCQWAGVNLPSESQWEHAARGPEGWKYPWGNEWDASKLRCSKKEFGDAKSTAKVGSYPANAYGLYDMAGNVWEWCADWYDAAFWKNSANFSNIDPVNKNSNQCRVLRGGSWYNFNPEYFRASYRFNFDPAYWYYNFGFRGCSQD